jgi:hypothetical protein
MAQDRKLTAPTVYPDNAAFWDAAGEGRLLVKHCNDCGSSTGIRAPPARSAAATHRVAAGQRHRHHLQLQRHAPRRPGALRDRLRDPRRRPDADQHRRLPTCDALRIGQKVRR